MPQALIETLRPLQGCGKIGIAVSGGRDSVALMLLAAEARVRMETFPEIVIYSVDHGLRAESAAECGLVGNWARAQGFAHRTLKWNGPYPSANILAKARDARYRLLAEAAGGDRVSAIVTAHHRDDQAETVLLRLARGSGVRGLSSMMPACELHGMTILRPLLDVPRTSLEAFVKDVRHPWIDDPSNESERFERIKIRNAASVLNSIGLTSRRLADTARSMQRAQSALDLYADRAFVRAVRTFEFGFASVDWRCLDVEPDEIVFRTLARLIAAVAGVDYPPRFSSLERLCAQLRDESGESGVIATLSGCAFERLGPATWIYREAGRRGFPELRMRGGDSLIWDQRFVVDFDRAPETVGTVRALGALREFERGLAAESALGEFFPTDCPKRALATVPAFLIDEEIVHVAGGFTAIPSNRCDTVAIRPIHRDMRMNSLGNG